MKMENETEKKPYTCSDYRLEMVLVGLKMRLQQTNLNDEERRSLLRDIEKIEKEMGL